MLRRVPNGFVNLVYLDPPFFSKRIYETTTNGNTCSFTDKWQNGLDGYLSFMHEILRECHRTLAKTGSLYLHCDWHASHYLKIKLDEIFGYNNFRNEIIWRRHNAHNDTKQGCKLFGRVHDTILFYSKTKDYTWNPTYQAYPEKFVQKYYKYIEPETGRLYAHGDLSGPGGRSKGNPKYEFLGVTRYWRFVEENMYRMLKDGKIVQKKKGRVPVMKRYLDEMPGLMFQDVWDDIKSVQVMKKEMVDYPTQKPLRLLERIIEISSNPNDLVLDPFFGSGTTLVAAKNMGRKYIGIDSNESACRISRNRLKQKMIKISHSMVIVPYLR